MLEQMKISERRACLLVVFEVVFGSISTQFFSVLFILLPMIMVELASSRGIFYY